MSKQDLFNKYKQEICKCCLNKNKNDCNIHITLDSTAKCCNYKKDNSKIKGYKKPLTRTAKLEHCVMSGLISNWEKRE